MKNSIYVAFIILAPLASYAGEEHCYDIASAYTIPTAVITSVTAVTAFTSGYLVTDIRTPEIKHKLAECLKKADGKIQENDTASIVMGIIEEGNRNGVKKLEIDLSSNDYESLKASIGNKIMEAKVDYEKKSNNTFTMKIEYK